jgi:hypothetical protein
MGKDKTKEKKKQSGHGSSLEKLIGVTESDPGLSALFNSKVLAIPFLHNLYGIDV